MNKMKQPLNKLFNNYLGSLKFIFTVSFVIIMVNGNLNAQNELDVIRNNWLHFSDAENSLYRHLAGQAFELLDQRTEEIAGLNSIADWKKRQELIRETLFDIVGPFPEKTPLNARILRTVNKEGYRVEHIVYESQPGFYVTSSLFIPEGLKRRDKAAAVIYCSGHSILGYRGDAYQHVILNLVKKGFIVFAFDPVGQGERIEYLDPETGKQMPGNFMHSYSGTQAFITGSSQAMYMIWDGIRAVDYLLTRREVDPARIGITGRSGGGTQSAYIAAMDDRIYAAAPENYLTTFTRLLQSRGPQDAEQNLFNGISRGIDQSDFLIVRAPKPALMIGTTRDMFNIHGFRENKNEVSRIYNAYGEDENLSSVEDDAGHASTQKNREAMYVFFQKHLENPGNPFDEETVFLTEEEIRVTGTGQVSTELGGETVYSLNKKHSAKRIGELENSRTDISRHIPEVLKSAKTLSGYREPSEISEPVLTGRFQREGYVIKQYFLKGEGDYVIPYLLMVPDSPNNKALIYLHPNDKAAEATEGGEIEWFVKNGFTVLAPDLLGIGETGSEYNPEVLSHPYVRNWFASILIGRSIVGIHAGDVVRLTRLLKDSMEIKEIYGFARKGMAPALLHAAAFEPAINRIALVEPYSSYRSIVMNRFYHPGFIYSTVAGALEAYDLPDIAASLAPRKLIIAGITDGRNRHDNTEDIDSDLSIIRTAFEDKNAKGQLHIVTGELIETPFNLYREWIK
jgi:hypothetical protein